MGRDVRVWLFVVAVLIGAVIQAQAEIAKRLPWDEGAPRFNGPRAFGATPGREFRHLLPLCGDRRGLRMSVVKGALPAGVSLDPKLGVISGRAKESGDFRFSVCASNEAGVAMRDFVLLVGANRRAQTPPMGWTTWNAHTYYPSQERTLRNARALVRTGLAARGYEHVNIDSCWQGKRTGSAALEANERFPEMERLVEDIHGLGLKAGIYSSPMMVAWGSTDARQCRGSTGEPVDEAFKCGTGGCGKTRFERQDAAQWAKWGFDFLKYDWPLCDLEHTRAMREALDATGRDFTLLICTGAKLDLSDRYPEFVQMVRGGDFDTKGYWKNLRRVMDLPNKWLDRIRPGFWYDMDMLAIGDMSIMDMKDPGDPPARPRPSLRSQLTRDESVTEFAVWAFLPSPLILSFEIDWAEDWLLDLVANEGLIDINQDWPCVPASMSDRPDGVRRYERRLSDGSLAVLFVNLGSQPADVSEAVSGRVRDVLAARDLPPAPDLSFTLRPHASRAFRITAKE